MAFSIFLTSYLNFGHCERQGLNALENCLLLLAVYSVRGLFNCIVVVSVYFVKDLLLSETLCDEETHKNH